MCERKEIYLPHSEAVRKRTFSMCINMRKCKCDMARRSLQCTDASLCFALFGCEHISPHSKLCTYSAGTFGRTKSNSRNTLLEIAFQEKPFRVFFIVSSAHSRRRRGAAWCGAARRAMKMRYTKMPFTQFCIRRFVAAMLSSQQPPSEIQLNIIFSCAFVRASAAACVRITP